MRYMLPNSIDFDALAAAFGTPFYLYDLDGALARVRQLRETLPASVQLF